MEITFFIIILILIVLLFDSYRRNSAMISDKEQLILSRETASDIAERVLDTHDPAGLYQYILESCLKLMPKAAYGAIFMFDSEGLLTPWASIGFNSNEIGNVRLKPEESFLYIVTEGKPDRTVIVNRPEEIAAKRNIVKSAGKNFAMKSEIASPLHINGDFVGMLCIYGDQSDIFSEQDANIPDYMSKQINIVIKYQKLNDEILYLTRYDSLSRLLNRTAFNRETVKLLNDPSKDTENLYFVLMDLDDLKTANDLLGQHAGDEIIQHFSETIRKHLGKNDLFGRYGGDEFAAVIQGDSVSVNHILEESNKELMEEKKQLGENSFIPGFSYGKATFEEGRCNLEMLCTLADRNLYEMKTAKKKKP